MKNDTGRDGITLRELFLTVVIIGLLSAIAIPNFKAARERDRPNSCYAAQKTIVGAMEMYNLDKNTKRTHLDEAFFQALVSGAYLESIPCDLGGGAESWRHFRATNAGTGITCEVHGPMQMPADIRKP